MADAPASPEKYERSRTKAGNPNTHENPNMFTMYTLAGAARLAVASVWMMVATMCLAVVITPLKGSDDERTDRHPLA